MRKQIEAVFLLSMLIVGAGCANSGGGGDSGGGGGSAQAAPVDKPLFSKWTQQANGFVLDIENGGFGTSSFTYTMTNSAICDCALNAVGSEAGGTASMNSCSYRPATGNGMDPGCASLNANYTYTKSSEILTVCLAGTSSCETYK